MLNARQVVAQVRRVKRLRAGRSALFSLHRVLQTDAPPWERDHARRRL